MGPAELVRVEAAALLDLAERLDGPSAESFRESVELLAGTVERQHRVLLTGMGKSGIIARKIAATLRSTGTPAHFLHPSEALHGDLGMLTAGDVVVALSSSGETEELLALLPVLQRKGSELVAICGCMGSTLASAAKVVLDVSISGEACPHNLAPTASTTVMLALGDALAMSVSQRLGFRQEDFADLHPGGRLGKRLTRVRELMHSGAALPSVAPWAPLPDVIYEMSRKKLGMTTVMEDGRLLGMVSDGDLRRLLGREGAGALTRTAAEIMNGRPVTVDPGV
ncbi:MAG: KpsF/GutQ family sugar-phosphate isomerase [Acidobacteriaceae bacterium]